MAGPPVSWIGNFYPVSGFIQVGNSDGQRIAEEPPGSDRIRIEGETRGSKMRHLRYLALLSVLMLPAISAHAGVAFGVGVGVGPGYYGPPACAYGYYGYPPYACAPYGYYGPNWFAGGVFIGAGPWYRGYWGRGWYGPGWRGGWGPGWRGGWGPGWYGRGFYGHAGYGYRGGYAYRGGVARAGIGGGFHGGMGGGGFHGGGGRR